MKTSNSKPDSQKLVSTVQTARLRVATAETLSPMDLPSREKWFEYSRARDMRFKATDTKSAPWHILRSDNKKRARLNCIQHILDLIPYKKVSREKIKLPKRSMKGAYDDEVTIAHRKFIPEKY